MNQDKGPPRSDKFLSDSHFIKTLRAGVQLVSAPFLLSWRLNYKGKKVTWVFHHMQRAENGVGGHRAGGQCSPVLSALSRMPESVAGCFYALSKSCTPEQPGD